MSAFPDESVDVYARTFARLCGGALPALLDSTRSLRHGARVVDVGTGTGNVACALAARGFAVSGVDPSAAMIAAAASACPGPSWVVGALPALPFPSGSCAASVANFVVNHVAAPHDSVCELRRITARGGPVITAIWPSAPAGDLARLWRSVMDRAGITTGRGITVPTGLAPPPHLNFERSVDGLAGLLAGAGLTDVDVQEYTWEFTIDPYFLWETVPAGIATTGATYRAQDDRGRAAMREAYEHLTGDGLLTFSATALIGSGLA